MIMIQRIFTIRCTTTRLSTSIHDLDIPGLQSSKTLRPLAPWQFVSLSSRRDYATVAVTGRVNVGFVSSAYTEKKVIASEGVTLLVNRSREGKAVPPHAKRGFPPEALKRLRSDTTALQAIGDTGSVYCNNMTRKKVAIIGAGAAGLISAKELKELGHDVVVYEQTGSLGGVWAYTDAVEDDLMGVSRGRRKVHGSMYKYLRTNLPREVMGVSDFPFDDQFPGSKDPRQYCSHEEVYRYLDAYARHFDVIRHVKYRSKVDHIEPVYGEDDGVEGWTLRIVQETMSSSDDGTERSLFHDNTTDAKETVIHQRVDAIVVCNGHYSEPRVPEYEGQTSFGGIQMHSHNYRTPDPFVGKRVVVVGAAFSGSDISQELLEHGAHAVYLSGRNWEDLAAGERLEDSREVIRVPDIMRLGGKDCSVTFVDGTTIEHVDIVMYATGYSYHFPFARNIDGMPTVDDNRLCALYKHVFPPALAPSLSFVGVPWKVVPFPQFELQAKWVGNCLLGYSKLPSAEEMQQEVDEWFKELDRQGIQKRYTHRMDPDSQGDYNEWLASQVDGDTVGWPEWRRILYLISGMNRRQHGIRFREYSLSDMGAKDAIDQFRIDADCVRKTFKHPSS